MTLAAVLLLIVASTQFVDAISEKLDFSKEVLEALADDPATKGIALFSRYPARFSDNPSADYPAAVIEQLVAVERTGWHPHEDRGARASARQAPTRHRCTSRTSAGSTSTRTGSTRGRTAGRRTTTTSMPA